ncbi:MAG TPA: hypothetical protein PLM53_07760 [Spirochaetota bacterium]|nr:hypothetical protein [Spirochaetota bacterium]HQH96977.1 hypothetical protein [Spirochaetota bacterium]
MSKKAKVIAAGAVFLVVTLFIYCTVRFGFVERDRIGSLVVSTNDIVRDYHEMEKRLTGENRVPSPDDLSSFLKFTHRKYPQVALMAVTDGALSLRLSSKNDRYIRSPELFEAILKDFTQEKFNITKTNPYAVRYYEEKSGGAPEQLKFYIFLNKIGPYRLLVVYPHAVAGPVITRSALEVALLTLFVTIITAAAYIALTKKMDPGTGGAARTIDLDIEGGAASRRGGAPGTETANVASDGLGGYIHELFTAIHRTYGTDAISFYVFHSSGRLVKTMELVGATFLRIDSASFDTIDVANEAGRELRDGATMVLDEGRKIIMPLVYHNTFLGTLNLERRGGFQGGEMGEIRNAIAGVLKNIHDHIMVNDMMTDPETGLNSKLYYKLKYSECVREWKGRGRDFSVLFIGLFRDAVQVGNSEKGGTMKLLSPVIAKIVGNDGYICRHDEFLAVIMPDATSRKAGVLKKQLVNVLSKYRIRTGVDAFVRIEPRVGVASTDAAGPGEDPSAVAMGQVAASSGS